MYMLETYLKLMIYSHQVEKADHGGLVFILVRMDITNPCIPHNKVEKR